MQSYKLKTCQLFFIRPTRPFPRLLQMNPNSPIHNHQSSKMSTVQSNQPPLRILMLPWLAHGHISPFLELAKKLSSNNLTIHLCSTPANLKSITLDSNSFPHIHLTALHLSPNNNNNLPPHLHTTKNLPSHLMPLLKTAFDESAPSLSHLLQSLSPHLLIYDFLMPWAPLAASHLNIPSILFLPISASASSTICHSINQFPFLTKLSNNISDGDRFLQCINNSTNFIAVRSFREIEGRYIDNLSSLVAKDVIPVGPLMSVVGSDNSEELEWLSGKEKGSVVFVSVGTEYFMTGREMEEMAIGLELCGLFSIWVVRFEGGEGGKRVRFAWERGLVVEGWCPQKRILEHASVGGFVTHCGWSSVVEGMRRGVPMIAMPLQLDQPFNARLMVEIGVAVEVGREEGSGIFRGEELARCVREVVVEERGESVRRKAKELGRIMGCKEDEEIEVLRERIEELVIVGESGGKLRD